jgi:hypothetical protein
MFSILLRSSSCVRKKGLAGSIFVVEQARPAAAHDVASYWAWSHCLRGCSIYGGLNKLQEKKNLLQSAACVLKVQEKNRWKNTMSS